MMSVVGPGFDQNGRDHE